MRKGIPNNMRGLRWHKQNDKKRASSKRRRFNSKQIKALKKHRDSMSKAEKQYQDARLKELGKELTFRKRLWLQFISFRLIVIIRKSAYHINRLVKLVKRKTYGRS